MSFEGNGKAKKHFRIMEKGDIIWAKDTNAHFHPIVYLEEIDDKSFKACILSHKDKHNNYKMEKKHLCIVDENGNNYQFQYDNTHLVINYSFIKMNEWIEKDPQIVGRLTDEGIQFVEMLIPQTPIYCPLPIFLIKKIYINN